MPKLRVESFTLSLDGFGAGPDQDINNPLGVGGTSLHRWAIPTRTFQKNVFGHDGGETGVDEDFAARGFQNAYFSPSWTAFQADRGRDFSVIVDGVSN